MDTPVVIVGGGPIGLSLGVGLAHHGIRSVILEQRRELSRQSKAPGIHARTLEIFRAWGLLDAFLREGQFLSRIDIWIAGEHQPRGTLDLSALGEVTSVPGVMIIPQDCTESLLAAHLAAGGLGELRLGHRVAGFDETADSVRVQIVPDDGSPYALDCEYLAGCDGPHSVVREQIGWQLEGKTYPTRVMLADVVLPDARNDLPFPRGAAIGNALVAAIRIKSNLWRLVGTVAANDSDEAAVSPTALSARVELLFGEGPFETVWASVFNIHCRTSPHFRRGRVVLAGDAAHINSPAGGQGMNSGIHDAHNLAWKLARALHGGDAEALLASYEMERRPVIVSDVDRYTDLLTRTVLMRSFGRSAFLRIGFAALQQPALIRRVAPRVAMLDTRYRTSPLISGTSSVVGARAPDGDLVRSDGSGCRLLDLGSRDAAVLLFDDGRLPRWNVGEVRPSLEKIDGVGVFRIVPAGVQQIPGDLCDSSGRIWRQWRATAGLCALVRPDGHVGWIEQRPTPANLRAGVVRALGLKCLRNSSE